MSSKASLLFLSLLTGAASLPIGYASAETIGNTVSVAQLVTAQLAKDTRNLASGDLINQDELIEVSQDGSGEFKLLDDTKLALGPGARLTLDKFVYDPAKSGNSVVIRFAKGAFRFVTGLAEKPAYVIHVPSASITVRGTIFDVFVEDGGTSWLLLHEGAVRVCNATGTCRDHSEPGKLIRISSGGELSKPTRWATLPGIEKISFDTAFPFVGTPPSVDPKPVLTREAVLQPTSDTAKETPKRRAEAPKKKRQQQASAEATETPAMTNLPPKRTKIKKTNIEPTGNSVGTMKDPRKTGRGMDKYERHTQKTDRYTKQREKGLDTASQYAPTTIDKLRKNGTIERADAANSGGPATGWRKYVDRYYSGR